MTIRGCKNTLLLHLPMAHNQQLLPQTFFAWAFYGLLRISVLKLACFNPNFTNWSICLKFDRTERFILRICFFSHHKNLKSLFTVPFCRFKCMSNRKMISTFHYFANLQCFSLFSQDHLKFLQALACEQALVV